MHRGIFLHTEARLRAFHSKTHLDVGGTEFAARKPGGGRQFGVPIGHVARHLRIDEGLLRLARYGAGDRADEERHARRHPLEDQFQQQDRHDGALGVVHPISVAQAFGRSRCGRHSVRAVSLDQVFDDRAGFGDGALAVDDHGRFAERMNLEQFGRRQHRLLVALVVHDLVGHAQFFKQPQNAVRARILKVMDDDHGFTLPVARRMSTSR